MLEATSLGTTQGPQSLLLLNLYSLWLTPAHSMEGLSLVEVPGLPPHKQS